MNPPGDMSMEFAFSFGGGGGWAVASSTSVVAATIVIVVITWWWTRGRCSLPAQADVNRAPPAAQGGAEGRRAPSTAQEGAVGSQAQGGAEGRRAPPTAQQGAVGSRAPSAAEAGADDPPVPPAAEASADDPPGAEAGAEYPEASPETEAGTDDPQVPPATHRPRGFRWPTDVAQDWPSPEPFPTEECHGKGFRSVGGVVFRINQPSANAQCIHDRLGLSAFNNWGFNARCPACDIRVHVRWASTRGMSRVALRQSILGALRTGGF